MLVFVDESGDCGLKGKKDSSRSELRMHEAGEFRFNKCRNDRRLHFLERVSEMDFSYLSVVIIKEKVHGPDFKSKDSFQRYATMLVLQNAAPYLNRASVTLDKSGGPNFTKALSGYLKEQINANGELIRKVKSESSHSNNLLQLADMVCGAVHRSFRTDKKDAGSFRKKIGHRELEVQLWPRI
jgi:hypothetical protein